MAPRTTAGGNAERSDDAPLPPTTHRLRPYTEAKNNLHAALAAYLGAIVDLGGDPAANLELARVTLEREINTVVSRLVLTVPLTDCWARLVRAEARAGGS